MDKQLSQGALQAWGFPIPKLKSVIAVFFGLFCILCFKKLIGFRRRWRNILIDWGYRSLNVPSLWTSDAVTTDQSDVTNTTSTSSTAASHSTSGHPEPPKKPTRTVPALRVPDAWSNFLLTWLHLNVNMISNLVPAWISAVNSELSQLCCYAGLPADQGGGGGVREKSSPFVELRVASVRQPISPPRISSMETSASGSTRELHFQCTLSSPEVFLELALRRRPTTEEDTMMGSCEQYLLHLQQVTCRVKIICAILQGDYALLSWRLVSPLLTQPIRLLDMNMEPVTQLRSSDARWIKDNVYLAIQAAVTRVVVSPLCFTVVQPSVTITASFNPNSTASSPTSPTLPGDQHFDLEPDPRSFTTLPANLTTTPNPATNVMHLRVLYAVLLEPVHLDACDPLLTTPLRCLIRWNLTLAHLGEDHVGSETDGILLTTSAVRLESKAWPNESDKASFLVNRFSAAKPVARSYMVVWNQDAYIPVNDIASNLLDVALFTESNDGAASAQSICGHAILPLPKLDDDPSRSQHVLLIDCHTGSNPHDAWKPSCVTKSPDVARAKFLLLVRVQLFSNSSSMDEDDAAAALDGSGASVECDVDSQVPLRNPSKPAAAAEARSRPLEPVSNDHEVANPYVTVSTEQLTEFMSPPGTLHDLLAFPAKDGSQRRRSRSFGDDAKGANSSSPPNSLLAENHRHPSIRSGRSNGESLGWQNRSLFGHSSDPLQHSSNPSVQSTMALQQSHDSNNSLLRSTSPVVVMDPSSGGSVGRKRFSLKRSFKRGKTASTQPVYGGTTITSSPSNATIGFSPIPGSPKTSTSRLRRLFGLRRSGTSMKTTEERRQRRVSD